MGTSGITVLALRTMDDIRVDADLSYQASEIVAYGRSKRNYPDRSTGYRNEGDVGILDVTGEPCDKSSWTIGSPTPTPTTLLGDIRKAVIVARITAPTLIMAMPKGTSRLIAKLIRRKIMTSVATMISMDLIVLPILSMMVSV